MTKRNLILILFLAVIALYAFIIVRMVRMGAFSNKIKIIIPNKSTQKNEVISYDKHEIVVGVDEEIVKPILNLEKIQSDNVTDFYKKSLNYAIKVLYNGQDPIMKNYNKNINEFERRSLKLHNDKKDSIVVAMKFAIVEPISAKQTEERQRNIGQSQSLPLWSVILRDAEEKVMPIEDNKNYWDFLKIEDVTIKEIKELTISDTEIIPMFKYGT